MREFRTSGSVGAPVGKPPGATRHMDSNSAGIPGQTVHQRRDAQESGDWCRYATRSSRQKAERLTMPPIALCQRSPRSVGI